VAGRVQPGLEAADACEQASDPVLPMLLSVHVSIVAYATDESRQAHKDRGHASFVGDDLVRCCCL
jgi:hypothetical protein